jgi:hypothetical protein
MHLFRRATPQTELEPAPVPTPEPQSALASAESELAAAAEAVQAASEHCTSLDLEFKTWSGRRESANRAFCLALANHVAVKTRLSKLTQSADTSSVKGETR